MEHILIAYSMVIKKIHGQFPDKDIQQIKCSFKKLGMILMQWHDSTKEGQFMPPTPISVLKVMFCLCRVVEVKTEVKKYDSTG